MYLISSPTLILFHSIMSQCFYNHIHSTTITWDTDGKADILLSNHQEVDGEALVAIMEMPATADISDTDAWTTHIVKQNFTNSIPRGTCVCMYVCAYVCMCCVIIVTYRSRSIDRLIEFKH
jgi:hypothetical protein